MEYLGINVDKGDLYRCREEKCHLSKRKERLYCNQAGWERKNDNVRLVVPIPRQSQWWKNLYRMRQAVERVFKGMKEARRLARHCLRGLKQVSLHAAMSMIALAATALTQSQIG